MSDSQKPEAAKVPLPPSEPASSQPPACPPESAPAAPAGGVAPAVAVGSASDPAPVATPRLAGRLGPHSRSLRKPAPAAPVARFAPEQKLLILDTWKRSGLPASESGSPDWELGQRPQVPSPSPASRPKFALGGCFGSAGFEPGPPPENAEDVRQTDSLTDGRRLI